MTTSKEDEDNEQNVLSEVCFNTKETCLFQVVPKEIWQSDLWQLICACVVEPSAVGFNMGDVEIMKNLPQEVCY